MFNDFNDANDASTEEKWEDNVEDCEIYYEDDEDDQIVGGLTASTAKDAFLYSMRAKGTVDLDYMSSISGISVDDLIDELAYKLIWPDPDLYEISKDYRHSFVPEVKLLTCNLSRKLEKARKLQKETDLFNETISLLESKLPSKVMVKKIYAGLGAPWIPVEIVSDFVTKLLGMAIPPVIEEDRFKGKWTITLKCLPNFVSNNYTYGTNRITALEIIEHMLNSKTVKVYNQVYNYIKGKNEPILSKEETIAAQEREKLIRDEWQKYLNSNKDVVGLIEDAYMESFGFTNVKYDGSYLDLPDFNSDVQPYKHQLDAIARIIMNYCTLLAHSVGAGKSLEFSAGVHELLRLKLGHKALIVVPNTTLDTFVGLYKSYYPNDKILTVYPKKNFSPKNRTETLNKMKSDEYQVIIMAYSSFDMLTMSKDFVFDRLDERLASCKAHFDKAEGYCAKMALKSEYKRLKKYIDKFKEDYVETETACFDELGIDILVIDEVHNYKNITLDNVAENVVGVHSKGSKKADNTLDKVDFVRLNNGHIIFSTGTPITNSMADLYVMMRYLQHEELQMLRMDHFNDFVSTFTEQTSDFEVDVDSNSFRFVTRFGHFHNLPELMSLFSQVCDSYQADKEKLGLPDYEKIDVVIKKSKQQQKYIENIGKRADAIRHRLVKRDEDNLLKITVDGRKCALDIRLVEPLADVTDEDNKVKVCAKNIARLYADYPATTQIAFCDISTPKEGFNIYDELKNELIKLGIPAEEIKFIHDATSEASRTKIEKEFNEGKVRVLVGSTTKLGTGCNVQEKLLAVHHLDIPWRPADMVQREGRLIRQGNTNKNTYIFRYVTEASFDSYTWQLLEKKQRFIAEFLSASMDAEHRSETDCAETVLDYAEIKALAIGNPLIKERVKVANELEQAKINQRHRKNELTLLNELVSSFPDRIAKVKKLQEYVKADQEYYEANKQPVSKEDRIKLGEAIFDALADNVMKEERRVLTTYQDFQIILPAYMKSEKPFIILHRANDNIYSIKMDGDKVMGCSKRLDYVLEHLGKKYAEHCNTEKDLYAQWEQAKLDIEKGNEFSDVVEELAAKLVDIDKKLQEVNK